MPKGPHKASRKRAFRPWEALGETKLEYYKRLLALREADIIRIKHELDPHRWIRDARATLQSTNQQQARDIVALELEIKELVQVRAERTREREDLEFKLKRCRRALHGDE